MTHAASTTLLLVVTTALLSFSLIVPRLRGHWPLWARALTRAATFVALTLLVQHLLGSPLRPQYGSASGGTQFWEQLIEASWWIVAARAAVGVVRLFVVLEGRPRETKIVSDLLAGSVYTITALAVINFAFDVPIRSLVATSGVIAIVLGLALQSTLADVFSGIAVGIERPYKPGDLLWVEGGIEGTVVEINWRSTQIATGQSNVAIVPNSIIAKSRLVNRSAPTPKRGDTVAISLAADALPERSMAALNAAVLACVGLLPEPAPSIACTGLQGDGVSYDITFYVNSSSELRSARAEIYTQVQRHLRHAGIALAVAGDPAPPAVAVPTLDQVLALSDLFGLLAPAERTLLAEHFSLTTLQPGDVLIREDDSAEALFLIASGTAEITRRGQAGPRVMYRISPGESLGVVGLITGSNYTATATALTALTAYRLEKADLAGALKMKPELANVLVDLASRGKGVLSRNAAVVEDAELVAPDMLLPRLRNFLRLLGS